MGLELEARLHVSLELVAEELCSLCVVLLLGWLLVQIVQREELKRILITSIDHNLELNVVELIIRNTLDARYFHRVNVPMNPDPAVEAKKDAVVDAHVIGIWPAAVEAVLIVFVL